jgi:hypothetical protein
MTTQPGQITLQGDQIINIALPAAMWVEIITVVEQAPISLVRAQPLSVALREQLQQAAAQTQAQDVSLPPKANGVDPGHPSA